MVTLPEALARPYLTPKEKKAKAIEFNLKKVFRLQSSGRLPRESNERSCWFVTPSNSRHLL